MDRTLSALMLSIVVISSFLCMCASGEVTGGQLTEDQKTEAIYIATNDTFVRESIMELDDKYPIQHGRIVDKDKPWQYTINDVTIARVHEKAPEIDRWAYRAAVEIAMGNRNESDVNIYAYVDTDAKAVTHIGYAVRPGTEIDGYRYEQFNGGVNEYKNDLYLRSYHNKTIVSRDYHLDEAETPDMEAKILSIAKKNETVKKLLEDRGYGSDIVFRAYEEPEDHSYAGIYPQVFFYMNRDDGSYIMDTVTVIVDPKNDMVLAINKGTFHMPKPDPIPPGSMGPQ